MRIGKFLSLAMMMSSFSLFIHAEDPWMSSTGLSVKFGVWDKSAPSRSKKITFEVKGPNSKLFTVEREHTEDSWTEATFPDDFREAYGFMAPGKYEWTAKVGEKKVGWGRWSFTASSLGLNQ